MDRFNPPTMARARRHSGFTLIELMVAVALLALLLGIAVPSMTSFVSTWRRDAVIESITGDLRLAKSSALRTSRPVVVCASANGTSCTGNKDWRTGWIVFSDLDGDNLMDPGEPLIAQRGAPSGVARMETSVAEGRWVFRSNGMLSGISSHMNIETGGVARSSVRITVNATGRAYVAKTSR